MKHLEKDTLKLINWFLENQRPLPWRLNKNPYQIWLSEVMLQQTTVTAVIPYFQRFLSKFPTLESLATSRLEDVLEAWSGLGYYSRARNLHKAAVKIFKLGHFPRKAAQLLELPGFGPYTSRAVASLAFSESVGVLDGNVIRVLSRKYGLHLKWWITAGKDQLQKLSDQMALVGESSSVNQGLMELGATVCIPQNPKCDRCPWLKRCVAKDRGLVSVLPLVKPRKANEIWLWHPHIHLKNNRIALIENSYAPFLKGQWLFPGEAVHLKKKPIDFDLTHGITHHNIFVKIQNSKKKLQKVKWVPLSEIKKHNPTSLVTKVITHLNLTRGQK